MTKPIQHLSAPAHLILPLLISLALAAACAAEPVESNATDAEGKEQTALLQKQFNELKKRLAELEEERSDLKEQVGLLEQQKADLEAQNKEKDQVIRDSGWIKAVILSKGGTSALERIQIPEINFQQAEIADVVHFLNEELSRFLPGTIDGQIANREKMILRLQDEVKMLNELRGEEVPHITINEQVSEAAAGPVTFSARNISLRETIRIIARLTGLEYRVKGGVLEFVPRVVPAKEDPDQLRCGDFGTVAGLRPLATSRVRKLFPQYTFYSVNCIGFGPFFSFVAQPLVIDTNGIPSVLASPPAVAKFLSDHTRDVKNLEEAREVLLTFADLQSFSICRQRPKELEGASEGKDPDWAARWAYQEEESKDGWIFTCAFLTDPEHPSYSRFRIVVNRSGKISVERIEGLYFTDCSL